MSRKERANPFSINSLLKFACIFLGILLVIYFVKTQLDMIEMQEQVELQRLRNKDAELSLREDDETMERAAREKLDYAHPDERIFVDISGTN